MKKNKLNIYHFWQKRAKFKNLKCTNDKMLEDFEKDFICKLIKNKSSVLDIGCGDGDLLLYLNKKKNINGIGLDYSENLIKFAQKQTKKIKYLVFDMNKIDKFPYLKKYDIILTKRSIQNLLSWKQQKNFLNKIYLFTKKKTKIFLIESSADSLKKINIFRNLLDLNSIKMPWHNLYFDDYKIKRTNFRGIKLFKIHEPLSTYYFISRVLNASLAENKNKLPKYDDFLNQIGWRLPQRLISGFSQIKVYEFRKK